MEAEDAPARRTRGLFVRKIPPPRASTLRARIQGNTLLGGRCARAEYSEVEVARSRQPADESQQIPGGTDWGFELLWQEPLNIRTPRKLRLNCALSGCSRGQCHYATCEGITVGDDPACDVQIPAENPDFNGLRHVRIRYSQTGWSLCNLGTSTVAVNHAIVVGEPRLKSGDVIRLSLAGPELMFSIVANRRHVPASKAAEVRLVPVVHDEVDRPSYLWYAIVPVVAAALLLLFAGGFWLWTNRRPAVSLQRIPDQTIDEGRPWTLDISNCVASSSSRACGFRPVGALPAGMTLDEKTGQLSWTPNESQGPGWYPVRIEVHTDRAGAVAVSDFAIDVAK